MLDVAGTRSHACACTGPVAHTRTRARTGSRALTRAIPEPCAGSRSFVQRARLEQHHALPARGSRDAARPALRVDAYDRERVEREQPAGVDAELLGADELLSSLRAGMRPARS
jgi:hypothetical protein